MIYSVRHVTDYCYTKHVFLEPHILRLLPRPDPAQQVLEQDLRIEPVPAGQATGLDIWGNGFLQIWFNNMHQALRIESTCRVRTMRDNPFDYFLAQSGQTLPMDLSAQERADLESCLARRYPVHGRPGRTTGSALTGGIDRIAELARTLKDQTGQSSTGFLLALNAWIFEHIQRRSRPEPGILDAHTLMGERTGSCRDLAVLFVETCREAGIPARFVSGYQEGDPDQPEAELHAWAEAYLPGIGWRGYDPTHGLAVADRHVALAAAPEPEQAMPLTGNYRGTGAASVITHAVWMIRQAE